MRESEGKRKEVGTAERFPPDFISEQKVVSGTVLVWGFYNQTPFTNYKNNIANTISMGAK